MTLAPNPLAILATIGAPLRRALSRFARRRRVGYLQWRLRHVEADVRTAKLNIAIYEGEAEALRCELAQLGELRA